MGHIRHSPECKARFDAIFGTRSAPPTPAPVGSGAEPSRPVRDGSYSPSIASQLNMDDDIVPECPPRSDEEDEGDEDGEPVGSVSHPDVLGPDLPAAVTRQLPRDEVLSAGRLASYQKRVPGHRLHGNMGPGECDRRAQCQEAFHRRGHHDPSCGPFSNLL